MAFIDNVKGKLALAGQTTVQKAKDVAETAKLNAAISDAENQINELYSKIGYAVYCAYKEEPLAEAKELIEAVSALHDKIEDCKNQIKAINAANTCPQCGAKIGKGMAFCSGCGYKLPVEEVPAAAEQPAFCGNCGAALTAGSAFCTSCGTKVN